MSTTNLPTFTPRILSGVQPSGALHIGNYFGAIKQHIELQHEYPGESFYFIANYHALTTIHDKSILEQQTLNVALDYLALGLDPTKATYYRQSDVPQVNELMWIFSCVTTKGLLDRAHSYKDKVARGLRASVGLFMYPELMAADILAVRSTVVPVGEDQVQHLEMTRDIAESFNKVFSVSFFPLPETRLNAAAAVVPGIDGRKMSKSYENTIPIFLSDEELNLKVMAIKTSSAPAGTPLDSSSDTLFSLFKLVATPEEQNEMAERYTKGNVGYRQAKEVLYQKLSSYFLPFKEKRLELEKNTDYVEDVLLDGAKRARGEIIETLENVREIVGLGRYKRIISKEQIQYE